MTIVEWQRSELKNILKCVAAIYQRFSHTLLPLRLDTQDNFFIPWIQRIIRLKPHSRGFHVITNEIVGQLPELINIGIILVSSVANLQSAGQYRLN